MLKPKLFIGSSSKNQRVADVLAEKLDEYAEVTVWDDGVFGLNYGPLETLLNMLEDFDFAVFVLAPDDVTTSKDETKPAPRDNVLFESGLFMGVLGRDRVFLVYDKSTGVKIPGDFAGVTLASYDGTRINGAEARAAVSEAARLIGDRVRAPSHPSLVGEWKSEYMLTAKRGSPLVSEEISVRASGDCLCFVTTRSSHDDYYTAWGRVVSNRQIVGKWKSHEDGNSMNGAFMLIYNSRSKIMYGYSTSPDERGGAVYGSWVLAKMSDADEDEVERRMEDAREMLREVTVLGPTARGAEDGASAGRVEPR